MSPFKNVGKKQSSIYLQEMSISEVEENREEDTKMMVRQKSKKKLG